MAMNLRLQQHRIISNVPFDPETFVINGMLLTHLPQHPDETFVRKQACLKAPTQLNYIQSHQWYKLFIP